MILSTFDLLGYYGPWIQGVITIVNLRDQGYYMLGFIFFLYIDILLNKWLKMEFKEPRPSSRDEEKGIPFKMSDPNIFGFPTADQYGMPSGHAQQILYETFYLYFVKKSKLFLLEGLFLSGLTIYQRWKYKKHSVKQLAYGSIIGIIVAYIGYFITSKLLKTIYL